MSNIAMTKTNDLIIYDMTRIKYLFLSLFLVSAAWASSAIVVVDSENGSPLAAASVFNNSGTMLGITDDNGVFENISSRDFPVTVRFLGYDTQTITGETDIVRMKPAVLELSEVTVVNRTAGIKMLCYAREYKSSISGRDTITIFSEKMIDYVIPLDKHVRKFKGHTSPRVLNSRTVARYSFENNTDSIARGIDEKTFSWIILASIENEEIKEPEALRGVSSGSFVSREKGGETIYRKNGKHFSSSCDFLYDKPNHRWSPAILKLLGATTIFNEVSETLVYPIKKSGKYNVYDIALLSYTMAATGRGKFIKKMFDTSEPVEMHSLVEVYPVECEPVTVEESIAIHKNKPEKTEFIIPQIVPPVDSAVQSMIDRSKL